LEHPPQWHVREPPSIFERWEADSAASTNPVDRLLKLATPVPGADIADIADILHPKSLLPKPDAVEAGKQEEGPEESGGRKSAMSAMSAVLRWASNDTAWLGGRV
jgi:hypothetical protein